MTKLRTTGDGNCFFNAFVRATHEPMLGRRLTSKEEMAEATNLRKEYIRWYKMFSTQGPSELGFDIGTESKCWQLNHPTHHEK